MMTTSGPLETDVAAHWQFVELVCSDEEFVKVEFDAIVAAAWTASPPDRAAVLSDQGRPSVPGPICPSNGLGTGRTVIDLCWRRQRSPPAGGQMPLAETVAPGRRGLGATFPSAQVNEATMHTPSDPYAELGIPRDATQAEITLAFRRLLRRYHPDTRGTREVASSADSDSALQRVLAAYSNLREARASGDRRPEPITPPGRLASAWGRCPHQSRTDPLELRRRPAPSAAHLTLHEHRGAPGRDRTCDPLLRRQSLYPLSYGRLATRVIGSCRSGAHRTEA